MIATTATPLQVAIGTTTTTMKIKLNVKCHLKDSLFYCALKVWKLGITLLSFILLLLDALKKGRKHQGVHIATEKPKKERIAKGRVVQ
jgi:hypothetical protein